MLSSIIVCHCSLIQSLLMDTISMNYPVQKKPKRLLAALLRGPSGARRGTRKRDGFFLVQIGIADERGKRNHRSPGHLAGGKKPKCSPIASLIVSFDSPQPRSNAPESPTLLCKVGPSYTRKKSADQATKTENQAQVSRGLPHTHTRARWRIVRYLGYNLFNQAMNIICMSCCFILAESMQAWVV